jgi:hypothetical protein
MANLVPNLAVMTHMPSETSFLPHEFAPRGELCSMVAMFTPSFTPTPHIGDYFTPRGQSSHLGDKVCPCGFKFLPRGENKNLPLFLNLMIL